MTSAKAAQAAAIDAERHPYTEGVRVQRGADGRTYRLCSACGRIRNHGVHQSAERAAQARQGRHRDTEAAPITAQVAEVPDAIGRHDYVWDGTTRRPVGGMGRPQRPCATCGQGRTAGNHSDHHDRKAAPKAPTLVPEINDREAAALAPKLRPPSTGRRGTIAVPTTPAEYVAAAIAIDRILALPADLVGWRLRLRLADVRPLLAVPTYPVLGGQEEAEPDPEAPPPSLVEDRPQLRPKELPVARMTMAHGIVRGIRSDRIKRLAKRALDQGWDLSMTGSGHLRMAKGDQVVIASTTAETGSGHGWGNIRSEAKRAGIDVTGL